MQTIQIGGYMSGKDNEKEPDCCFTCEGIGSGTESGGNYN